jgi:UDP-N-acetylglucosamine--N-acetylmuramyl-(pentapeptide) pyrophosphoryl-undecaprenol N-acetylglucosamine transferase
MSGLRIAIACGGSGGHLFPGLAVAEELRLRGHETLLLVSSKQIDAVALQGASEQATKAISTVGWPGFNPRLFRFATTLLRSWKECRAIFREFKPDAVLGMGGFTSAVPLLLASRRHIFTLLHESNAIPGRVTKLVAPRVNRTLLGFSACGSYLPGAHWVVTGTPVRKGLCRVPREEAAEKFGLNPESKTIFVMGGSQGARGINEIVLKMLPFVSNQREHWQFIHLTGNADANIVEINYRRQRLTAVVKPFSSEMEYLYSLADLVIARSGASSLTELSHYGLPSILIPLPTAAHDHQTCNARIFEDAGAATLFAEGKLTAQRLTEEVTRLLNDPAECQRMGHAAHGLAGKEAAKRVAEEIEKCNLN